MQLKHFSIYIFLIFFSCQTANNTNHKKKENEYLIFKKAIEKAKLENAYIKIRMNNGILKSLFDFYLTGNELNETIEKLNLKNDLKFLFLKKEMNYLEKQMKNAGRWDISYHKKLISEKQLTKIRSTLNSNLVIGSVSRIIYSSNKRFAFVAVEYTDLKTNSIGESFLFVFKKHNNKWVFLNNLGAMIS